jgi:hypothetical protein
VQRFKKTADVTRFRESERERERKKERVGERYY